MSHAAFPPSSLQLRLQRIHGLPVTADPVIIPVTGLDIGSDTGPGMLHIDSAYYVAPLHASVLHQADAWRLLPRNAFMVCAVNGARAPQGQGLPLQPGDTVEIGFAALRVEEAPPEAFSFKEEPWEDIPDGTEAPPADLEALLALPPDVQTIEEDTLLRAPEALTPPAPADRPMENADARALVRLLQQDFPSAVDTFAACDDVSLAALLHTTADARSEPTPAKPAGDDILVRLARESERLLRDPDLSGLLPTGTDHIPPLPPALSESVPDDAGTALPADILPAPETSLHDLLEGPLSVDDVLEQLGGVGACPLLAPDPSPDDPLRLLAGGDTPAALRVRNIAPVTRRDHHRFGMGTPCRRFPNAATLSPTEAACRIRKK